MSIQHQPNPTRAAPEAGCEVFSSEGLPVGKIDRVSGRFMRVNAPMQLDYWLCVDDIVTLEDGAVTLAYPHSAVPQHRLHAPRSERAPDPGVDPILLDEQEQLHQRELLERELEEQHRRMAERRAQASGVSPASPAEEERARSAGPARPLLYVFGAAASVVLLAVLIRRRRRARPAEDAAAA